MKSKYNEEDIDDVKNQTFCGYFIEQRPIVKLTVPIDTDFKDASHYRMVVNKIGELTEYDSVEFHVNSPGGNLDGLVALLHAIKTTEAETIAVLQGEIHSAASILALNCDAVIVGPYAHMLCHSVRFGATGKAADIHSQVTHTSKYAEKIFREAYEWFLNDQEIEDVLSGKELWLDNSQINERLANKYNVLSKMKESNCCGDPDNCENVLDCPLLQEESCNNCENCQCRNE